MLLNSHGWRQAAEKKISTIATINIEVGDTTAAIGKFQVIQKAYFQAQFD